MARKKAFKIPKFKRATSVKAPKVKLKLPKIKPYRLKKSF